MNKIHIGSFFIFHSSGKAVRRNLGWFMVLFVLAALTLVGVRFAVSYERASRDSLRAALARPDSAVVSGPLASPVAGGRAVVRAIEEKYSIPVVEDQEYPVKTYHGQIRAINADAPEVERYLSAFGQEFLLYPPDLFRRSQLKRIVLCRDLSFAGQARGAIPDFQDDVLYLDVVRGAYSRPYQRRSIHHEFFHILDYRDDGQVYSDEQWARLNPETFRYGDGGAKMQGDPYSGVLKAIPGFLTTYATSGVEEDKAEVFAYMMTEYAVVEKLAVTDVVLREKMSAMKKLLEKFCSAMDQTFWDEVIRGQTTSR